MTLKHIFLSLTLFISSAFAADFKMVVPFAPGSQSDIAARQIAQSFERITGNNLIVESLPGADGIIGVTHYKNNHDVDMIWLGASIVSYAPANKDDLPYKDTDFNHIIFVGTAPTVWITKSDSKIKKAEDLLTNMPEFVGGNSGVGEMNVTTFKKEKKVNSTYVPFKGAPDVLVNTMNGTISAGVMGVTTTVIEMQKADKINIIGSSYKNDVIIEGVTIPSVSKKTGVAQFNGFVSIATKPNLSSEKIAILKQGLWQALQDNETKDKLRKLYILPDSSNDQKWMTQHFQDMKAQAKLYSGK